MKLRLFALALLVFTACGVPNTVTPAPDAPADQETQPASTETQQESGQNPEDPAENAPETRATCTGEETNPIGESIAQTYDFTTYDQVMTWFCDGAEFEDILTALETETQTGTPAGEMLEMLADGFTWEEIWQLAGLVE